MDDHQARELLANERRHLEELLRHGSEEGIVEREDATEQGDIADSAEPFIAEEENSAVAASLRARLAAVKRAEARLVDGTYGLSVRSGAPLSRERLEADPAAELTVEELNEN
jgi:DnaK suppressor protein